MVGLGLSLVGFLGGSGGSACVVDGGSMRFFLVLSWLLFFFFFFFINCAGVLGLHSGDGGDERERDINIFYCVNILY